MQKLLLIIISISFLAISACSKNEIERADMEGSALAINDEEEASEEIENNYDPAELNGKPIDYLGTYKGTIHCDFCEGIEMTIEFLPKLRFVSTENYLGMDKPMELNNKGSHKPSAEGDYIIIDGNPESNKFKVVDGGLVILSEKGELRTGENADKYFLKKMN